MALRSLLAAVGALTLTAAVAPAASISQTINFSGNPDYQSDLVFSRFNPAQGTLTGINYSYQLNVNGGSLKVDNDAPTPASGTISFGAYVLNDSVDVAVPNLSPLSVRVTNTGAPNLGPNDGDIEAGGTPFFSYTGPDYYTLNGGNQNASKTSAVSDFTGYVGEGTYTVSVFASQFANYSSLGGVQAQIDPQFASGSLTIDYIYTAVPEPSVAGVIAAGVASVLGLRKREKKTA